VIVIFRLGNNYDTPTPKAAYCHEEILSMKQLKFEIDGEKLKLTKEESAFTTTLTGQKAVFEGVITQGLAAKYPQGLPASKRRSHTRLLDAIDAAKHPILKVEEAEFDLLKEIFSDEGPAFHPMQSRVIAHLQNAIDSAETVEQE